MASPIEQFEIQKILHVDIGGLDLSFTNSSLFMVIAAAAASAVLFLGGSRRALVPGRLQSFAEMLYELVANMIRENAGKEGMKYFPFIFTLFIFILFGNVIGIIPGTFTFTSHIIVTFALAFVVFLGVTVIGFARHGTGYFRMFFPHGAPLWTAVILIPVEIISYLSRPISLSVRLFANMTVGHVLLKVIGGFVIAMGVAGVVPFAFLVPLTMLELFIAALQAYIFAILSCVYLHDALHLH
ncbi:MULTISPECIES: F0F1 ATP synthase subunit A [Inquilinus]|uniref:ATP synthase subunit a n=1 Tax=Inquilinus ginsengisoli TaxID=363840 RepID=A0ABU1JZC0_9PROT|nr:F0F1 ATP synthase subunit A [Inquilinus ginsengisoli]MDR6293622.1 F-type H+-transporting ATPase subunit a [Inquilinus ginsengisoli]